MLTLAEKIRITREQRNLSQKGLGEIAGIHQKNISKYEHGSVTPSALMIKKIADALQVTTDYLLSSDTDNTIKDTNLLEQFKIIDQMPEKEKAALMQVMDAYIRDYKTKKAYSKSA